MSPHVKPCLMAVFSAVLAASVGCGSPGAGTRATPGPAMPAPFGEEFEPAREHVAEAEAPESPVEVPKEVPDAVTEAEPMEPVPTVEQLAADIERATASGRSPVMIDAPRGHQRWNSEDWANPSVVSLKAQSGGAGSGIVVERKPGDRGKWVVTISQPMDLSRYGWLSVEMRAEEPPVSVSVGFWTGPDGVLYETKPVVLTDGDRRTIVVDLTTKDFKSEANGWEFGVPMADRAEVKRLSFFFYGEKTGAVIFRKVRVGTRD